MPINPYLMAALEDPDLRDFAYLFQDREPVQPPVNMVPNPGMMDQWQPAPADESPGFLGHVSHALSYLNRPNSALWSAVRAAQQGRDIGGGAWRGLMGEEETGLSDILGIEGGKPTDDWLPWLGKSGLKLGADIAGDPLNALFLPIKGASLASRGAKALGSDALRRRFYETGLAKAFARSLPEDLYGPWNRVLGESNRNTGLFREDLADMVKGASDAFKREHPGMSQLEFNEAWARNPESLGPETQAALGNLKGVSAEQRDVVNSLLERYNLPQIKIAPEGEGTGRINWTPRPDTEQGRRLLSRKMAKQGLQYDPAKETEFVRLVDPDALKQGMLSEPVGLEGPHVTKKQFLNQMEVEGMPGEYAFPGGRVKGTTIPATSKDIAEASNLGLLGKNFSAASQVEEPIAAYAIDALQKNRTAGYLNFLDNLKGEGQIGILKEGQAIPENMRHWREINVPRLAKTIGEQEGEAVRVLAPKAIANQLENLAARAFDPSTPLGGIGSTMQHFFERTAPGQAAVRFKNLFNSATLPLHPGSQFGNAVSDPFLLYESGLNPLSILKNKASAVNVARGVGESLPGMSNQELRRQLAARDITRGSWSGSLGGDALSEAQRSPWYQGIPGLEQVGNAAHALTQGGYGVGSAIEGNSRIAAVLDFMKKNYPEFATMAPEAQATALDRASQWATNALVNYNLTPWESQASNIVPYLGWILGQPTRTAQILATHPERLNRVGMALDTVFQPLSNEEKQTADPWIRESMPVQGAFGGRLPETEGLPGMAMLSRFMPQGDLDRMLPGLGRPGDYAVASLLPPWKVPWEVLFNTNAQKGMPLDRVAGGFPGNLLNYFLDKPHSPADEKTLGWRGPEALRVIASEMPGGRYLNELNTLGRTAGIWQDETKPEMSPLDFLTWYATGGKTFPFDQGKYLAHRQRESAEQKSALKSQLKYFGGKGDEATAARLAEILAAASSRNPMEGAW